MMKLKRYVRKVIAEKIISRLPAALMRFPVYSLFMIEPTSRCNLKCPLCPTSAAMTRGREDMSYDSFVAIVDDIAMYAKKIALWNFGEPFLNRDLFRMIAYAEGRGIGVVTSTNATIWRDDIYTDIFDSGLSEIVVCLDGASKRTHEAYRVGSDFEMTVNGIRRLCREKQERTLSKPLVTLQFVVMKDNENEIGDLMALARAVGVDRVSIKSVSLGSWVSDVQRSAHAKRYLPDNASWSRYDIVCEDVIVRRDVDVCSWTIRNGVVLANGDLTICCYDYDGRHVVGNVLREGYSNILKSARFRRVRRNMATKRYAMCRQCQYGSIELSPIDVNKG